MISRWRVTCVDPESEFGHRNVLAYQSCRTALNAVTVAYAKELRETSILSARTLRDVHRDRLAAVAAFYTPDAGILKSLWLLDISMFRATARTA